MALVLAIATSQIHDAVSKAGNVLEQVRSSMRTVGVRKSVSQSLILLSPVSKLRDVSERYDHAYLIDGLCVPAFSWKQ